ncbi:hypothetical protein HDU98_002088 [Podochytrium sp. JEL0797]|nr:hypothetical protein HDU98_002088 [Podochytrium sp. JEL0797]
MNLAPPSNKDECVVDWKYDMRREIQQITQNLFLGPYQCARDLSLLQKYGITHMLAVTDMQERKFMKIHPGMVYQHSTVVDSLSENLIPHFPAAKYFLENALKNPGNRVLVYCNNGMSRSPCFVIAYLMESMKWDFETAFG